METIAEELRPFRDVQIFAGYGGGPTPEPMPLSRKRLISLERAVEVLNQEGHHHPLDGQWEIAEASAWRTPDEPFLWNAFGTRTLLWYEAEAIANAFHYQDIPKLKEADGD